MVVWSYLARSCNLGTQVNNLLIPRKNCLGLANGANLNLLIKRGSSGHHAPRVMRIEGGRFQWNRFRDLLQFYFLLGIIPLSALVMYCNIFIGPAKLAPIPEGYEPKHWEYYSHPISRFFARYIITNPQQDYEKYMHRLFQEDETRKIRRTFKRVKDLQRERLDYQGYYYRPAMLNYAYDKEEEMQKDSYIYAPATYPQIRR